MFIEEAEVVILVYFVNSILFEMSQLFISNCEHIQFMFFMVKCHSFQLIIAVAEKGTHVRAVEHLSPDNFVLDYFSMCLVKFHEKIVLI